MPTPPRSRRIVASGVLLLATGVGLLAIGCLFVDAWLVYLSARAASPGVPTCLCPLTIVKFVLPPNPASVLVSYGVAVPVVLALAFLIRRWSRTDATERDGQVLRMASLLLWVATSTIPLYLAVGLVLDALRVYAPWPLGYPFLGMVLAVPVVILVAALVDLYVAVRRPPTARSRVARG